MSTMGRILICDDDDEWVRGVKGLLTQARYSVVAAYTVSNSIKYLTQNQQNLNLRDRFAVVIVDLEFTDKGTGKDDADAGFKILEVARKDPLLESIVCTGFGSERQAARAITVGAFGYIRKNAPSDDGNDLVQTVVRANQLHNQCLNLIEEIDRLAVAHPGIPAIKALSPHFVEYVRNVRGRGR